MVTNLTIKTRGWGFRRHPSGRSSRRHHCRSMFALGLRIYGYRTVSGRSAWPSRDPIGEQGGDNLYGFWENDMIANVDGFGLQGYIGPNPQQGYPWLIQPQLPWETPEWRAREAA